MVAHHTASGTHVNRTRYSALPTLFGMARRDYETEVKRTLLANCKLLMERAYGKWSQSRFRDVTSIGSSGATAIARQERSVGIDRVAKIAAAFSGVEPWQLLAPQLGADLTTPKSFDSPTLISSIEHVEDYLLVTKRQLPPATKAALVTSIYEHCIERGEAPSKNIVQRYLRLVS